MSRISTFQLSCLIYELMSLCAQCLREHLRDWLGSSFHQGLVPSQGVVP